METVPSEDWLVINICEALFSHEMQGTPEIQSISNANYRVDTRDLLLFSVFNFHLQLNSVGFQHMLKVKQA